MSLEGCTLVDREGRLYKCKLALESETLQEQIFDFNMAGYKYDPSLSEDAKPVFTRVQP